ncbi:MAG: hypothetical protein LBJ94_00035 [Puniceicoccales bacterium]|jgi:penicillin-binding protein 2|nr:hypothetical protein [Puniceicoccales bacterium]
MKLSMNLLKWCQKSSGRIKIFQSIALAVFIYLFCGLFFRQILQHSYFQQKSRQQSARRIIFPAARGNIYDRNGNILVENRPLFSLNLYLDELSEKFHREFAKRIKEYAKSGQKFNRTQVHTEAREFVVNELMGAANDILGKEIHVPGQKIDRHINQCAMLPMTILDDLSAEECEKLTDVLPVSSPLQIGVSLTRHHPNGALACHVLGYTVLAQNQHLRRENGDNVRTFAVREQVGKSGVEKCADHVLAGEVGYETWIVDHSGNKSILDEKANPRDGQSVYLSIDKDLQKAAEEALRPYAGSIIVMDVNSGEILALANSPSYDPNLLYPSISKATFNQISEKFGWLNQAMQGLFPMGSIFKLISAIAFVKSEKIDIHEKWSCTGVYQFNNKRLRCNNHPRGECVDLGLALGKSCNTYMFDRAFKVGHEPIAREAKNFGLDSKTEIELPYETEGMTIPDAAWKREHNLGNWLPGDTFNLAIGQGYVLTTPLNVCCFTAALAKNRYGIKPTIFKTEEKAVHGGEPCLCDEEHKFFVDALVSCVENYTGRKAKIDGLAIAGKTGTSQFRESGKKRNLAWFICFAPAYDPKIALTVLVREQAEGLNYYGGSHAAPIARKILLNYFKLN